MYRNATGKAKDLGDTIPERLAPGFMFHAMRASSVASEYVCARQAAKNFAPVAFVLTEQGAGGPAENDASLRLEA